MFRSVLEWLRRLLHLRPVELPAIPEIMYSTDKDGKQRAVSRGWIKHQTLSDEQTRRVERLRQVLREAYPMTMEGWIDGFLRDANPEQEIQIIEACAFAYQQLSTGLPLSVDDKQELYGVLCSLSTGAPASAFAHVLLASKRLPDFQTISVTLRRAWADRRRP
jgi:hypothetical protein